MKRLIQITLLILSAYTLQSFAEDKKPAHFSYDGKITGLYCSACADKVKAALGKLEGVTRVKITSAEEQGTQKLHLESSSDTITKDAAIKALGEDAKSFTVLSLERAK